MKKRNFWTYLGYYGFIYILFVGLTVVGYPLAQTYAKPIAALIFPINEDGGLLRVVIVMSAMYWGMVGFYMGVIRRP